MSGARGSRTALRWPYWRRVLLMSGIAACASSGAFAYPDRYKAEPRTASVAPLDIRLATVAPPEEEIPGAAWSEAARLASYLRVHHASDYRLVTLYPLAAYAATTRRADADAHTGHPLRGYAYARRDAAMAAGGNARSR